MAMIGSDWPIWKVKLVWIIAGLLMALRAVIVRIPLLNEVVFWFYAPDPGPAVSETSRQSALEAGLLVFVWGEIIGEKKCVDVVVRVKRF